MTDPTTAAITAQIDDRDQLRAENARLAKALVAAYTQIEVTKADQGFARMRSDMLFGEGYDQAVREIHEHFKRSGQAATAHEIEKIWLAKEKRS